MKKYLKIAIVCLVVISSLIIGLVPISLNLKDKKSKDNFEEYSNSYVRLMAQYGSDIDECKDIELVKKSLSKIDGEYYINAEDFAKQINCNIDNMVLSVDEFSVNLTKSNYIQKESSKNANLIEDNNLYSVKQLASELNYEITEDEDNIILSRPYASKRIMLKASKNVPHFNAIAYTEEYNGWQVLQFSNETDTENALKKYDKLDYVYTAFVDDVVSTDTAETISLDNNVASPTYFTGETSYKSWGAEAVGADVYNNYLNTISSSNKKQVYVAVIDSGIDDDHWGIYDRIYYSGARSYYNKIASDDTNITMSDINDYLTDYTDNDGHGTHVSGTIIDLTPSNVKVIPIKTLHKKAGDSEATGNISSSIIAINYVSFLKDIGINVTAINMSMGAPMSVYEAYNIAINEARSADISVIAASGNDNTDTSNVAPANSPSAITVSSITKTNDYYYYYYNGANRNIDYWDSNDDNTFNTVISPWINAPATGYTKSNFSNYDTTSDNNHNIDIGAPGSHIYSSVPGNSFSYMSGTSMAAPHVSACIALLSVYNYTKNYTVENIESLLLNNALNDSSLGLNNRYHFGAGMVNLENLAKYSVTIQNTTTDKGSVSYSYNGSTSSVGASKSFYVNYGDSFSYTTTANSNTVLYTINGRNVSSSYPNQTYTHNVTNVTSNQTITIAFSLKYVNITASIVNALGAETDIVSISPTSKSLAYNSSQKFTLSYPDKYKIDKVTNNGVEISGISSNATEFTISNITTDTNIVVTLSPIYHAVAVSSNISSFANASEVTSMSLTSGTTSAVKHNTININFSVNRPKYNIASLTIDGVSKTGEEIESYLSAGKISFVDIVENHTINIQFEHTKLNITVNTGSGGSASSSGKHNVLYGENFVINNILSYSHYNLSNINITTDAPTNNNYNLTNEELEAVKTSKSYTLSNVIYNHSVTISFTPINYTVSVSAGSNGHVRDSSTTSYSFESNITEIKTIIAIPNEGYQIASVTIGLNVIDNSTNLSKLNEIRSSNSYIFEVGSIIEDTNISFAFEILTFTVNSVVNNSSYGSVSASYPLVEYNGSQTFTIACNTGYHLKAIKIGGALGVDVSSEELSNAKLYNTFTLNNIKSEEIVYFEFEINVYNVNIAVGDSLKGSASPTSEEIQHGGNLPITISLTEGYYISDILVDGSSIGSANVLAVQNQATATKVYTLSNVIKPTSILIEFEIYKYDITASTNALFGSVTPSFSQLNYGENLDINITCNTGYYIKDILDNGTSIGQTNVDAIQNQATSTKTYSLTNIDCNHEIEVVLEIYKYAVTSSVNNTSFGSITPTNPLVDYGSDLDLTITPSTGYYISDILLDNVSIGTENVNAIQNQATSSKTYTLINVITNHEIKVNFAIYKFNITAELDSGSSDRGSVSCASSIVDYGTDTTIYITANTGYHIHDIEVNSSSIGSYQLQQIKNQASSTKEMTLSSITEDTNVKVYFEITSYSISFNSYNHGSIKYQDSEISEPIIVNHFTNPTFTIVADAGYYIDDIKLKNLTTNSQDSLEEEVLKNVRETGNFSLQNVSTNYQISVTFALKTNTITITQPENGRILYRGIAYNQFNITVAKSYTITVQPNAHYQVKKFYVDGVEQSLTNNSYTISNSTKSYIISAELEIIKHTITVNADDNSFVFNNSTKSYTYTDLSYYDQAKVDIFCNVGYELNNIVLNGNTITKSSNNTNDKAIFDSFYKDKTYTFKNLEQSYLIYFNFTKIKFNISFSIGSNGGIEYLNLPITSTISVEYDDNVELKMTPNAHYKVKSVLLDNIPATLNSNVLTIENITDSHNIFVQFELIKYTITASTDGNGYIDSTNNTEKTYSNITYFDRLNIRIICKTGYNLSSIVLNGTTLDASTTDEDLKQIFTSFYTNKSYTFSSLEEDLNIQFNFSIIYFSVSYSSNDNTKGSISVEDKVAYNESVTYTITPITGYKIKDIKIGGSYGTSIGSVKLKEVNETNKLTITNNIKACNIYVEFDLISYKITFSIVGYGKVYKNNQVVSNSLTDFYGTSHLFEIIPNENYCLTKFSINSIPQATSNLSFDILLDKDYQIELQFELKKFKITILPSANGKIIPADDKIDTSSSGEYEITYGEYIEFKAIANNNYTTTALIVDGVKLDNISSYIFTAIDREHTLSAEFKIINHKLTFNVIGNGHILCKECPNLSSPLEVKLNTELSFNFEADTGYRIKRVKLNDKELGNINCYVVTVLKDYNLEVEFEPIVYLASINVGSSVSFETEQDLNNILPGSSVTINLTAPNNVPISKVYVNGVEIELIDNSFTIDNVDKNLDIWVISQENGQAVKYDSWFIVALIAIISAFTGLFITAVIIFIKIRKLKLSKQKMTQTLNIIQNQNKRYY